MQSTLSVGCFIRIICAEIKNFKDPDPCCVPSVFAPAYIFHLYLRMGCTWSNIKAQVKSKVLHASIACLPLRLLCCTKWNESFHLDQLTVTRQTNSKPICLNITCQFGKTSIIMPCLCLSLCQLLLLADLSCLAAQYVWTEQGEQRVGALTDMCSECCLCQSTGC